MRSLRVIRRRCCRRRRSADQLVDHLVQVEPRSALERGLALGLGAGFGFGVVEVAVRLIDDLGVGALLSNPATYALLIGGGAAFLLLTSALQRGSVTTATAGLVIGETIGPALVGVVWLGDRTREDLGWLAILGFAVAVAGALALARFGEAPEAAETEAEAVA